MSKSRIVPLFFLIVILLINNVFVASVKISNDNSGDILKPSLQFSGNSQILLDEYFEAYCYVFDPNGQYDEGIYGFNIFLPNDIYNILPAPFFISGICFVPPSFLYLAEYGTGTLWFINLLTLDFYCVGGGGSSLHGLDYNVTSRKLYGINNNALFEIDIDNGGQTYIGSWGSGYYFSCMAICDDGCYGYDAMSDALYIIDLETADLTFVANPEFSPIDIAFDWAEENLYLISFSDQSRLYHCDRITGQCAYIGSFPDAVAVSGLSIYYYLDYPGPYTTITFDPPYPNGNNGWYTTNVTVTLNATDDTGVNATYYRINGGVWEVYESPFVLSNDNEYLIEFYSVDNEGYIEVLKTEDLFIDQTASIGDFYSEEIAGEIMIIVNCSDLTSGVDYVDFIMDNCSIFLDDEKPYEWVLDWPYPPPLGFLSVVIYDIAGNCLVLRPCYTSPTKMIIFGLIQHPVLSQGYLYMSTQVVFTFGYYGILHDKNIAIELYEYSGYIGNMFIMAQIKGWWISIPTGNS